MTNKENGPYIFRAEIYWMLIENKINEVAEGGKDVVPALIRILRNDDVRWKAVEALGKIGKDAVNPLIDALCDWSDPKELIKEHIARALEKIGKDAVNPLINVLDNQDERARAKAASALGEIGSKIAIPEAVNPLIRLLNHPRRSIRGGAIVALGKMCSKIAIPEAVNPLIRLLKDTDFAVRAEVADALLAIKDERGVKFAKLIGKKEIGYALELGLEETRKVLVEFVKIIEQDRDLAKTNRVKLELGEFYGKVVAEYNKGNAAIKVKDGELLKDTVKPPNGNNGMYRAIGMKQMVRT